MSVGGGVGSVARCVDCMMICAAAFSPADGSYGQVDVECVAQFNPAVSIRFKPFTPPSWLNLLDSFLILLSTSAAVTRIGCPGSDFRLATLTVYPGWVTTVVPASIVSVSLPY